MSFLLRRGATPQLALDALNEAITRLQNAVGAHPSSPAAEYVKALPDVEMHLGNAFNREWVAETLYTPRCWHLMEIAHQTIPEADFIYFSTSDPSELEEFERKQNVEIIRLGSANNAASNERRLQMERLEEIREDVRELETFASMGGTILIIDTNTLMHANPLDQIVWTRNGIAKGEMLRVLVPLAVIAELDRKKFEAHDNTKKKAADAIRRLYKHRKGLNPDVPASFITTDKTTLALEIPRDDLGRTRTDNTDDEIRDFGVFVKGITGRPVTVVTRDMNLHMKCLRAGLETLWLDQKDMKQDQAN